MKRIALSQLALVVVMAGCAAERLKPGAERIRMMQQEPKGCNYLGEATGNQGNFITGKYTSNESLETGARNTLKNKALDMGGNVLVLLTSRAGQTGEHKGESQQTNVTLTGTVFNCPDAVLAQ
jgi:hypothetical protein